MFQKNNDWSLKDRFIRQKVMCESTQEKSSESET